jgi:hypothetical protein
MELGKNKNVDILLHTSCILPNHHGISHSSDDSSFSKNQHESSSSFIRENNELHDIELESSSENTDFVIEIYRFKFTDSFMEQLYLFSKIHQFDNRKDFKESWNLWTEEYSIIIQEEIHRLHELGFKGDILDKMFKSARYYFRKRIDFKRDVKENGINDVVKEAARKYQCSSKLLLETMDLHIKHLLRTEDSVKKPSIAFLDFCKENKDLLKEEIQDLLQLGITELKDIQLKIKKTYKNKYFSIIHK